MKKTGLFIFITKQINLNKDISNDSLLHIIDISFPKNYEITKISQNRFRYKRHYQFVNYTGNKRTELLHVTDSGFIKITKEKLNIAIDLSNILIFNVLLTVPLFLFIHVGFNFHLLISALIPIILSLMLWINIFIIGNRFLKRVITVIQQTIDNF